MNFSKKVSSFVLAVLLVLGMVNIGYLLGVSNLVFASVSSPVSGPINTPTPTPAPISAPVFEAKPSVSIIYPANGQTVTAGSNLTIIATASSPKGVNRVVFHINGSHLCTDYSPFYGCFYRVPNQSGVKSLITVWVIDNGGNKNSQSITITSQ